jgi:cobalt-zinc-cadmium resistance protein CzcA
MIEKFVLFSLNNRKFIIIAVILLAVWGLIEVFRLPLDAIPDITNNQVQVITTSPSLTTSEMELLVNFPLEQAIRTIPDIVELRSLARNGLSVITVVFKDHTDIFRARQQISEKIGSVMNELPAGLSPYLGPVSTGLSEIYQYILRPKKGFEKKYSLRELREIQDWIVRRQILGTPGIADVSSFGGYVKQMEINIHPAMLYAYGLSITDIARAIEAHNRNEGSAYIEKNGKAFTIRTEGIFKRPEDIENIIITSKENTFIRLGHIAEIREGNGIRYGAMVYTSKNGKEVYECVGGIALMLKGENSRTAIENIKTRIREIQKNLPEGIEIVPFLDRTKMVNSTIQTVKKNLLEGAAIVIFILVLLFGSIKFGLLVAGVIPLSMLMTFSLMNLFGISGNLMSLGALDFGLIVDGAVIVAENILHRMMILNKTHLLFHDKKHIIRKATSEMLNTSVFGQMIILLVYVPILLFSGIEGKMFKPMAITVIFALASSFLLTLTYIPVVSSFFRNYQATRMQKLSEHLVDTLRNSYLRLFYFFIRKSKAGLAGILIFVIFCFFMISKLGGEFIPELEEGDFAVETRMEPGTSLENMIEKCKEASGLLARSFPDEVEMVVSKIGSSEIPTDPMPLHGADMMVILRPVSEWKKASSFNELSEKMQIVLQKIKDAEFGFQYPVQMRFNELMAGAKQEVVCKIFGENNDTLKKLSEDIRQIISNHPEAEGVYIEESYGQPELKIQIRHDLANYYGVNTDEINQLILSANAGLFAGKYYQNERNYNIMVRLNKSYRNADDIKYLTVMNARGQAVYLHQIADISVENGISQTQRENGMRRKMVGFNIRGSDPESAVNTIKLELEKQIKLPQGYFVQFGGAYENLQSAKKQLYITIPLVLVFIFFMLFTALKGVKNSLLILTCIPLSVTGGIIFLYMRDISFSVSAAVGFIALFGIAILNGLVLLNEFQTLAKVHKHSLRIIITGISNRFRPVITTSLVAALGFIPMYLNTGMGANVQRPLATVVIGGLLSSTILTLFVLPVLYYRFVLNSDKKNTSKQNSTATPIFILSLFFFHVLFAQSPYSLQTCMDSLEKNFYKQSLTLLRQSNDNLKKQVPLFTSPSFDAQAGQYNSVYFDHAFSFVQTLPKLSSINVQRKLMAETGELNRLYYEIQSKELEGELLQAFFGLIVCEKKRVIFDSLEHYSDVARENAELKFKKGDINIQQKNSMMFLVQNIRNIKQENIIMMELQKLKLKLLTGIKDMDKVVHDTILYEAPIRQKLTFGIQLSEKEIKLSELKIRQLKTEYRPEISWGVTSQTLRGLGSDDIFYGPGTRFHYVKFNISLPLNLRSTQSRIKSENLKLQAARLKKTYEEYRRQNEMEQFNLLVREWKKILSEFHTNILPDAYKAMHSIKIQIKTGNINLQEFYILTEQLQNVFRTYYDYVEKFNNKNIEMYIKTK